MCHRDIWLAVRVLRREDLEDLSVVVLGLSGEEEESGGTFAWEERCVVHSFV